MNKKRHRSSVTGRIQSEDQAVANLRESVTESVRPPSVEIKELVDALDDWGLESLYEALESSGPFPNRAALMRAINDKMEDGE